MRERRRVRRLFLSSVLGVVAVATTMVLGGTTILALGATTRAGAVPVTGIISLALQWQQTLADNGTPVGESSPMVATLDGRGSSVVVGDRAGGLYAFHLSDGSAVSGWPAQLGGPIDATPSVAPDGSGTDNVYIGVGNAAQPRVGGYEAVNHAGVRLWSVGATDPNGVYGVQASLAIGTLQGAPGVVAPSLGQNAYALRASSGAVLPGWPFFTADSGFTTPALADLYGDGRTEIIQGGDSTAGNAENHQYTNGGHLRILSDSGGLLCSHDTNQTVDSSPAVGNFLAGGNVGIAFGTGNFYPGASDSDTLFAADGHCNIVWRAALGGNTFSSPALGDLLGDGNVQVVEGVDTGTSGLVWALNGSNGTPLPGWPQSVPGRIIGGVVTADLTGGGYNDVLVPTTSGLVIFDGKTARQVAVIGQGAIGLQNSPLVTIDPGGSIGITIAGYNAANAGFIQHYQVVGSAGRSLGVRSWPMYHQNPKLTGWLAVPAPGHLSSPVVSMASTSTGRGYWCASADGGIFAFGDAGFYGSMGGTALNRPVVAMAATPSGHGYWEVASDGGIFAFGDAGFYGSMGGSPLNRPIVGLAPTPSGHGYWEVASDGGIFAFGDAGFYRSMGGAHLNEPIVGMAANAAGHGYWLVASDGGIFAFGDAGFHGSTGSLSLHRPIVGMAATPSGGGYWLVASDGGIFAFGNAAFLGSTGGIQLALPVVAMARVPAGSGYWLAAADGGLFAFGTAGFYGSVPQALAGSTVD